MIKTLIVDDSPLVRSIIRDFLESEGSFEIIGEGENGFDGVTKAKQLLPQLITMDIEMPVLNGLDAIEEIIKTLNAAIVVISTHDTAKTAYDATVRGAMEFFSKDMFTSQMTERKREEIFTTLKHIVEIKGKNTVQQKTSLQTAIAPRKINCIVIAASTGGPMALCQLCSSLPEDFSVPIILVQHNTSGFDIGFVQWLGGYTRLNVKIAEKGTIPLKGCIYVAPTDKHLVINSSGIDFDDGKPVHNQKPAADVLFNSAASLYRNSLISVVLTGIGDDGADGSRSIKQAGGITIAQDEASSMVYGMPQAAVETGCIDMVLPLKEIAQKLVNLTEGA